MDMTFCKGIDSEKAIECPIRHKCLRFNPEVDYKTEKYLASVPYNFSKKECEFLMDNLLWGEIEKVLSDDHKDNPEV